MKTNERLKILRGQLESHDGISVPGPFNTRVTDREGLDSAVNELKKMDMYCFVTLNLHT